jgi:hypothetical protein
VPHLPESSCALRITAAAALLTIAFCPVAPAQPPAAAAPAPLTFACAADNDLYRVLTANGAKHPRFATPADAVKAAAEGSGVLIMADGYPATRTAVEPEVFAEAARKKLRLYVEYPQALPDTTIGDMRRAGWERTVVASDAFGPELAKMRILHVQDCHFVPIEAAGPHLVLAKVAGYDTAAFGLPPEGVWPLLFEHPGGDILVATTKLSQFVTARYAPADAWPPVWRMVIGWLAPGMQPPEVAWTPVVRPSYGKAEALPADAERLAIARGVDWFAKGRLYVHPDWQDRMQSAEQYHDRVGPGPTAEMPVGDGTLGLLEAFSSRIDWRGEQPVRWYTRADCNSEAAMALALHGRLADDADARTRARNLANFVLVSSNLQQGPRADPANSGYGLLGWDTRPAGATVYYGDDNARALLGLIAAAAALESDAWDEAIAKCALANFRTTGPAGFRRPRIEQPALDRAGWRSFWETASVGWMQHSPHYQAYLWAVYLWLYDKTGFEPLYTRTERAIRTMMRRYPDRWDAECGRAEAERARMLLPLAWLVRVKDTPEHRRWLADVAKYVVEAQDDCGAIVQRVTGHTITNAQYGTMEAPLIHADGDPCTDLLYTTNFAFLGLHEAAAATGDPELAAAADKLADFLVRCQARADRPAELDGTWFRGFDFRRWDYWGSNADLGWGVWSTETGWTQGWITGVLALRQLDSSFWDFTKRSRVGDRFDAIRRQMLPDDALLAEALLEPVRHAAVGRPVVLTHAPAAQYAADGPPTLLDGRVGNSDHTAEWLGFHGRDLEATIDLGEPTRVDTVAVRCLEQHGLGIFLPEAIAIEASDDGETFRPAARLPLAAAAPGAGSTVESFSAAVGQPARFIRLRVQNLGTLPAGHPAAGQPAWLFVDEILVNPEPRPTTP